MVVGSERKADLNLKTDARIIQTKNWSRIDHDYLFGSFCELNRRKQ